MEWMELEHTGDGTYGAVIALFAFGIAATFAGMRATTRRKSHCWYGCMAAPVVFLVVLRKVVSLAVPGTLALVAAGVVGEAFGRHLLRGSDEPSGLRWRMAVYGTLAAALILMNSGPAHSQHSHHHHPAEPQGYQRLAVDEPAVPFSLENQEGARVSLSDLKGRAVVLTFMYTTCTDVCPILLHSLSTAEDTLSAAERRKVWFVGVTVDPKRDTPGRLAEFMKERGLAPATWHLLTGPVADVQKVANDYGVVVRPAPNGDFVHNSVFVVIDGKGQEKVELHGTATPAEVLVAEIRKALK